MVLVPGFESGFSNAELVKALGGKSAGKDMKPRGGIRAHGAKVFGFAGHALCCSGKDCESAAAFARSPEADPETFEAVVGGCPTDGGHAQKLKDLVALSAQDKAVVVSNQKAGWVWHGFYKVDVLATLANPQLARVRYTKRPASPEDVAAMAAALEEARGAVAKAKQEKDGKRKAGADGGPDAKKPACPATPP